jgi:hypothetical protein
VTPTSTAAAAAPTEAPRAASTRKATPRIGWREWIALPAFGVARIKAKVDTGARTSALHAFDIRYVVRHGTTWVLFSLHPRQKHPKPAIECEAPLAEERYVTDSGGRRTLRPVIVTTIGVGEASWDVELTLIARDEMGFRMLLGRQAIRGHFVVDPGRSFLASRIKKGKGKERATPKAKGGAKAKPKPLKAAAGAKGRP